MKNRIRRITTSSLIIVLLNGSHFLAAQTKKTFYRLPSQNDSLLVQKNKTWFDSIPTKSNYQVYFEVATSFWQLKRNKEAQTMFARVEQSGIIKYKKTYLNGSDIESDTINTTFGYGSFTFNFKNKSSLYLAKILIENQEFEKALRYVSLADKQYIVKYNCGTGSGNYSRELLELYTLCYEGLNQTEKVIELLMPTAFWHRGNTDILSRALKNKYSQKELKEINRVAFNSIRIKINDYESHSYVSVNGGPQKKNTFISGDGFIILFDKEYRLPSPNLKNGETITKEHFINSYKKSRFYQAVFEF